MAMKSIVSDFKERADEVISRLELEETLHEVITSEAVQKMVEEEFDNCLDKLRKLAIFIPVEKETAKQNVEKFSAQKDKFISDFSSNFRIVWGMHPYVFFSGNVKDDEDLKEVIMELFEASKIEGTVRKTLEYQINTIVSEFGFACVIGNNPKNITIESILAMLIANSDEIKLPSTITFF